jgi:hypothetical protein
MTGGPWGAIIGAGVGLGLGAWGGYQQDQINQQQMEISEQQLGLNREQMRLSIMNQLYSVDKDIAGMEADREDILTDIVEAKQTISGYQGWLDNYASMYETETTAAQSQIAELETSGRQAYESLMQSLGYADAVAGATGRTAPGTSMAGVAGKARQNIVDYAGEDMSLDMSGGLYGLQRTSAELGYQQLELDLASQLKQTQGNLENWTTALYGGVIEGVEREGFLGSLEKQETALESARKQRDVFQKWVDAYTGAG